MTETLVILGAGATKSVGGPLTREILYGMLQNKNEPQTKERLLKLEQFLVENFHLLPGALPDDYPGLPLLMSLLDLTMERRQPFIKNWDLNSVSEIRAAIEMGIFDLLELKLQHLQTTNHYSLLQSLYPLPAQPCVISLNYDLTVDTAMMFLSEMGGSEGKFPDYCCDIRTEFYKNDPERYGTLLKLHGSLNWLYCKGCHRLEIGFSSARKYLKIMNRVVGLGNVGDLDTTYMRQGNPCQSCGSELRPLLIAPTHLKNYRNPHVTTVWYEAERALRECKKVIFVGYSLPDDDLEVVYLLKRGLAHLNPWDFTVVEYDDQRRPLQQHEVGRRYRALFGDVDWHPEGLDNWLASPRT